MMIRQQTVAHIPNLTIKVLCALLLMLLLALSLPKPAAGAVPYPSSSCAFFHIVRRGDSIKSIASMHDVTPRTLVRVNGLTPPYHLSLGQIICIPWVGVINYYCDPTLYARLQGSRIWVQGSGYAAGTTFYVKVKAYSTGPWKKIGQVSVRGVEEDDDDDDKRTWGFKKSFPLPISMRKAKVITVCLKNTVNDRITCTQAFR